MIFDYQVGSNEVTATMSIEDFQRVLRVLSAPAPKVSRIFDRRVDSFTKPGTSYMTRIFLFTDGTLRGECECPDHVYRGRWCKHTQVSLVNLPDEVFRSEVLAQKTAA